jgi:hypothetical protein
LHATHSMADVLERGESFFFYRPRINVPHVHGLEDVARFYMVLRPREHRIYRRVIVGHKRLPEVEEHGRHWALVDRVARDPESIVQELETIRYEGADGGERILPAARPAGEAVYAIVDHEGHRHLAYRLEWPRKPGHVQRTLRIEMEASYVVTVRNPFAPSTLEGEPGDRVRYPNQLQAKFRRNRFAPLEPEMLDYEGTELVLIAATVDVQQELGISLDLQHESVTQAAIFRDLHVDVREHPIDPLISGEWA